MENESGEIFSTEKEKIAKWLGRKGGNWPVDVKLRRNSDKTPELKKIKFKIKTKPTIKGKLGEKVQKITSFFEKLSSQNKIGVEVGLGVEESGGLSAKEKFAASGGGGEDKTVPGKGLGVIRTISNKATSARGLGGRL